jgi:hypothetical protein
VTSTFTYSFAATGNQLVGRFYDRYQKQFMANGLELGLTKPVDTGKLDAGARAELLFGQDAAVTQSQGLSLGPNGDLTEAYVVLNVPTGGADHWIQFKLGKMWTIMGYEVIDDILDPNLDVGNQFVYLENFTNTGLGVDFKFGPKSDAQLRSSTAGTSWWTTTARCRSWAGSASPRALGDDRAAGLCRRGAADNDDNLRYGFEGLGTFKVGTKTTLVAQFDWGHGGGPAAGSGREGELVGRRLWLVQTLSATFDLALRGDYVEDKNGVRTSGVLGYAPADARKFGSATATLNMHCSRRRRSGRSSASTSPAWMTTASSMIPRAPSPPSASGPRTRSST